VAKWYFLEAIVELNCRLVREKLRTEGLFMVAVGRSKDSEGGEEKLMFK
jgi:hypothetical protein